MSQPDDVARSAEPGTARGGAAEAAEPEAAAAALSRTPVRRGRGRRPSDEVRRDILDAAGRLLFAEGMAAFTIERVAAVAGVSKMSVYKGWPSKGALALDGYFHAVEPTLAFPDTGDIETDLSTQLRAFARLTGKGPAGRVVAELIGQAQTDPDLAAAFREHYSGPRRRLAEQVLERAKRRGQLRADVDPKVVIDQLWGACYHRLLIPDEPLDEQFAAELVKNLMRGLRPDDRSGERGAG